jgi:DEAD/DEAH box helicase domain-containing protein
MTRTSAPANRFEPVIRLLAADAAGVGGDVRIRRLPAREAEYGTLDPPLPDAIGSALRGLGIERLYGHQVEAIASVRDGRHTVIVTGTASGKSLCYQVPIAERLLADPESTTLLLFPAKALAQDQLRSLTAFADACPPLKALLEAGTYDGDTSPQARRKLRDGGNLILTNPEMLHMGILPYHGRWFRFIERLKLVVVDETHTYRGIFGSHVAHVMRRLRRVLDHYGVSPTFVFCSATIGNPRELAARLLGDDVHVVDRDGSPAGGKTFVFWNPPYRDRDAFERRSSHTEGQRWLSALVAHGVPTIVFCKTRLVAELVYRYAADALSREGRGLVDRISPYRGGYLPRERREIERRLFSGDLLGVVSTSALELGIDVGVLDASVLVGFPATVASTLQRVGRAGRKGEESLAVIIAYGDPSDQYLVRRPEQVLERSPEHGVVDLDNPYILAAHLSCAASELPLSATDARYFGSRTATVSELLAIDGQLKRIDDAWYWAGEHFPAAKVNLRNISDDTYTIVDVGSGNAVIGTVDSSSALELLYPEAIYLHEGRTYFVRELDLAQKVAFVEPREVDYYTQALVDDRVRIEEERARRAIGEETLAYGDLEVHWATTAFKKIQFHHQDAIGYHQLDLPYQELSTTGFWYGPSATLMGRLRAEGLSAREGMAGLSNLLHHILPLYVMCDRQDLGTTLETGNLGRPTLFVYDRYPGGLGFAEKGFERIEEVLRAAGDLVGACECRTGCPSCVGVPPVDPSLHDDPEVRGRPPIPGKAATKRLIALMVGAAG